jgi:hypothetical protein
MCKLQDEGLIGSYHATLERVASRSQLAFTVEHLGRGGDVVCRGLSGPVRLAIEMQANGAFSVWLRGAKLERVDRPARPLKPDERAEVGAQLRRWLDATDRVGWCIHER